MKRVVDMGIHEKVCIMAGITPLKSLPMAKYMATKVSGIEVPDEVIARLEGVDKKLRAEEGIRIAIEQIQEVKEIPGVRGVHLMAIEWEHKVPEIVKGAGLLPRPSVS
jgi:methylenetetrahydrofolate reductase (NADPH)